MIPDILACPLDSVLFIGLVSNIVLVIVILLRLLRMSVLRKSCLDVMRCLLRHVSTVLPQCHPYLTIHSPLT